MNGNTETRTLHALRGDFETLKCDEKLVMPTGAVEPATGQVGQQFWDQTTGSCFFRPSNLHPGRP